jgi:ABC-type polysaccharide/polyol phosphate export permease
MGFAWAVLMPVLIVCSGLVFRLILSAVGGQPFDRSTGAALAVKALPWAFFSTSMSVAVQSIVAHANLISKVYFARETLPLAAVLAQLVDAILASIFVLLALVLLGVRPGWTWLWIPVLAIQLSLFTVGCALFLSCANLFFRDVKYLVQVLLNFGVFFTPVFFEPELLGARGAQVMLALPLSPAIQGLSLAVVRHHNLANTLYASINGVSIQIWSPWMLWYSAGASVTTLLVGTLVFRHGSSRFAELA